MNLIDRIKSIVESLEEKKLPTKQKCKYCAEQADKRILHAEGMAYVPVCPAHLAKGKADVGESEVSAVHSIADDNRKEKKGLVWDEKAGVRRVRDAAFWGLPEGTPILPGMKPKTQRAPAAPKVVAKKRTAAKPARVQKNTTPASRANTGRDKQPVKARAARLHMDVVANTTHDGRLRAWGPEDSNQAFRRANVSKGKNELVQYVKPAELEAARKTARERARKLPPKPSKYDVADNKRLQAEGGVGARSDLDNLRGNSAARELNSWAMYVNFGGYDEKTGKDKGYVPCLGCGVKMSWHNNEKFTKYPKFEQDKIVVGRYGGSYNPQNLVPMCAGCNNQRGNKLFHESPVFKGAKPTWFDAAYVKWADGVKAATGLRPNRGAGVDKNGIPHGRPKKDNPNTPMPVPPGKGSRNRKQDPILLRIKSLEPGEDQIDGQAESGDRVTANLFNFDGRHNDGDNIWPPDVDDPEATVVGILTVEEIVESAFGDYRRFTVTTDDGVLTFVEADTVRLVSRNNIAPVEEKSLRIAYLEMKLAGGSNGPATGASNALNKYWTRGAGLARWANTPTPYRSLVAALRKEGVPGHMVNGLAAKYYKKVKGHWPGKNSKKAWELDLEQKAIRRVRTPEGVRRFKLPMGSIIIGNGEHLSNLTLGKSEYSGFDQVTHTNGRTFFIGQYPGESGYVVTDPNDEVLHEGTSLEDMFRWADSGGRGVPGKVKAPKTKAKQTDKLISIMEAGDYRTYASSVRRLQSGESSSAVVPYGSLRVTDTVPPGKYKASVDYVNNKIEDVNSPRAFDTREEAVEWAANKYVLQRERFTVKKSGVDAEGNRYRNDQPRDYEAFEAYDLGIRGVDWWNDGDLVGDDDYSRRELAMAELNDMGIRLMDSLGYGGRIQDLHLFDPRGLERIAQVLRTHENMYPGFSRLFDGVHLEHGGRAIAWNRTFPTAPDTPEGNRQNAVLGFPTRFWGANRKPNGWERDNAVNTSKHDPDWKFNHHVSDAREYADRHNMTTAEAGMIQTTTHEVGHSIGYIMWNMVGIDRRNSQDQRRASDPNAHVGSYYRDQLIEIMDSFGMLGAEFDRSPQPGTYGLSAEQIENRRPDKYLLNRHAVSEHLSTYGATNFQEIMAETWAAYQLNPEPGDFVRELGQLMETALQTWLDETAEARGETL